MQKNAEKLMCFCALPRKNKSIFCCFYKFGRMGYGRIIKFIIKNHQNRATN
jgi:hypothetical protein